LSARKTGEQNLITLFLTETVSRDNFYSIFFINHTLLVLLEELHEDFKFRRIFTVLFNKKGNSPVCYTVESGLLGVAYTRESGLTDVGYIGKFGLLSVAYTSEYRSSV
jgi:hypothetical protein